MSLSCLSLQSLSVLSCPRTRQPYRIRKPASAGIFYERYGAQECNRHHACAGILNNRHHRCAGIPNNRHYGCAGILNNRHHRCAGIPNNRHNGCAGILNNRHHRCAGILNNRHNRCAGILNNRHHRCAGILISFNFCLRHYNGVLQSYLRVIFYVVERHSYSFKKQHGCTLCYEEARLHFMPSLEGKTSCLWVTLQCILVEGVTEWVPCFQEFIIDVHSTLFTQLSLVRTVSSNRRCCIVIFTLYCLDGWDALRAVKTGAQRGSLRLQSKVQDNSQMK